MKRAKRANVSVEQRILILKRHLLEKVPISDLCQQHNIRPTTFYRWQKTFFENGHLAYADERAANADVRRHEDKIAALEAKLRSAHRAGGIARKHLANHEPIEEHANGGERLLHARHGAGMLLDVGRDYKRTDRVQADLPLGAPTEECTHGSRVRKSYVGIANGCGEELDERSAASGPASMMSAGS
jgi:transposase-like protein